MEKLQAIEPVDDIMWMSTDTLRLVLGSMRVDLRPGFQHLTIDYLAGVQIHHDETLPPRTVETGTLRRNIKTVRRRFTI